MTEEEWLNCLNPTQMLGFLAPKFSERKRRLFAVACCRRIWHLLDNEDSRQAVEAAERYAEGMAREKELAAAYHFATLVVDGWASASWTDLSIARLGETAAQAAANAAELRLRWEYENPQLDPACAAAVAVGLHVQQQPRRPEAGQQAGAGAELKERNCQSEILRDIAGNPLRPIHLNAAWLRWNDGCVRAIAQAIYDATTFDRLPILADALEDAGCDNADILKHCRQPGVHVRGCWVVDLLLGKS